MASYEEEVAADSSGSIQIDTGGSGAISGAARIYFCENAEREFLGRMDQSIYQGTQDSSSTSQEQEID